jgi:putative ATPase
MDIEKFRFQESSGRIGDKLNVHIVLGDITDEWVDAITNAANEDLCHGSGVAGAISRAGGPTIQRQSNLYIRKYGPVQTGTCGYTGGGNLNCKFVIHAVGPIWNDEIDPQENIDLLHSAVLNTLRLANNLRCKSVSIPAISSGIFGFDKTLCARTFFEAIEDFCNET